MRKKIILTLKPTNKRTKNFTGKIFGKLTVIGYAGHDNCNKIFWNCRCECGNTKVFRKCALDSGKAKSCGCITHDSKKLIMSCARKVHIECYFDKKLAIDERLSFDDFFRLSQLPCTYCAKSKTNKRKTNSLSIHYFYYNGLDRIDSKLSHTLGNCVPCCFDCNRSKSNLSVEDFISNTHCIVSNYYGISPETLQGIIAKHSSLRT